jgi:hypothetical protein
MAICLSLGVHYTTLRGTTEWIGDAGNPHTNPINGLANSRFHTLLFGINRLRSDEMPHCWAKSHCSGAIVQLFVQQEFSTVFHASVRQSRELTMERLADLRSSDRLRVRNHSANAWVR